MQLRVCGSGEDRDRLAALAAQVAPERIDVAPEPVPFEQIPAELERAQIGIVPTLHDSFTELLLPVKLLEYVHMGLPVVASRLPCISDYFRDGEDLSMFTPGDTTIWPRRCAICTLILVAHTVAPCLPARRLGEISWERQRERYLALVDRARKRTSASLATRSASPTIDSPLSSRG